MSATIIHLPVVRIEESADVAIAADVPTIAAQAEAVAAIAREVMEAAGWLIRRRVPAADLGRLVRHLEAAAATLRALDDGDAA
jgi:hypothetical protein